MNLAQLSPREFRMMCREGRYDGPTRGVALGFLECNLVIVRAEYAYEFLLYCQRNPRPCPVLEVCDTGSPEPKQLAPGADLRTDLPRYAVYRNGERCSDVTDIRHLWRDDFVAFLIGSGISFDEALERAGVPTNKYRWVLRSEIPTRAGGRFHGPMVVTMRWLTPEQAITATQVTSKYVLNHGAPLHIGDPEVIGADTANPIFGGPVPERPRELIPVFWACGVTPQAAAIAASIDIMIAHAPAHGFVADIEAHRLALP